jgi:hypothetical protein
MKKYLPHFLFVLLVGGVATASAIKVWTTGETLRAADLNSNFAHIHNTKVGDGILLVNADVSASAAISHSKLASPSLVPVAFAYVDNGVGAACAVSPCTATGTGVTSVTRVSPGLYTVTLSAARLDTRYAITASHMGALAHICNPVNTGSLIAFNLLCVTAGGVATDSLFSFVMLDN